MFRGLLKCKKEGTTFQVINFNVDHYDVIIRKLVYDFRQRLYTCDNSSVKGTDSLYTSNACQQWSNINSDIAINYTCK